MSTVPLETPSRKTSACPDHGSRTPRHTIPVPLNDTVASRPAVFVMAVEPPEWTDLACDCQVPAYTTLGLVSSTRVVGAGVAPGVGVGAGVPVGAAVAVGVAVPVGAGDVPPRV